MIVTLQLQEKGVVVVPLSFNYRLVIRLSLLLTTVLKGASVFGLLKATYVMTLQGQEHVCVLPALPREIVNGYHKQASLSVVRIYNGTQQVLQQIDPDSLLEVVIITHN